ncbi:flagellin [Pseudomonadales bacterium]|nr:flagellin [Pseudomonadales bacterium]
MSLVVNTNVSSLTAQRGLAESGDMLDKAMARLSSGSRINSASDDAAGLAIVQRMSAQINGLNMAVKNANDGISLTQSIEGALVEVVDMLQRVRELAVQSANDTNTNTDRAFLQEEVNLLIAEITRVSANTRFNQTTVLDGSFSNKVLQVGTEGGETIQFSVDSVSADKLGAYKVAGDRIEAIAGTGANANGTGSDDSIIINGNSLSKTVAVTAGDSAQNVATNINAVSGETGVTATAKTYAQYYSRSAADETASLKINGKTTGEFVISGTNVLDAIDKINAISGSTGVTATATSDYKVLLYANSGKDVTVENETSSTYGRVKAVSHDGSTTAAQTGTKGVLTFSSGGLTADANDGNGGTEYFINNTTTGQTWSFTTGTDVTASGLKTVIDAAVGVGKITTGGASNGAAATVSFTGATDFGAFTISTSAGGSLVANLATTTAGIIDGNDLNLAAATGNDTATIQGTIDLSSSKVFSITQNGGADADDYFSTGASSLTTVSNVDLRNQAGASNAISVLDGAIEKISSMRADLGAIENRLSYTVSNLMNVAENTADARSRINDADYSVESANLAKAQVLQQAGTAMLSQANARAQLVLQLLQ